MLIFYEEPVEHRMPQLPSPQQAHIHAYLLRFSTEIPFFKNCVTVRAMIIQDHLQSLRTILVQLKL